MTDARKEQLIYSVEAYAKEVERETYDKVLKIIWSKLNQLEKIVNSDESMNIFIMSTGTRFYRMSDKRKSIRKKIEMLSEIIYQVNEIKYGKF